MDSGWVTAAYVLGGPFVEIRVIEDYDSAHHWAYNWRVSIKGVSVMRSLAQADTEATAYRLACECAAAEARARLGPEAAAPIVDALCEFYRTKTQLALYRG